MKMKMVLEDVDIDNALVFENIFSGKTTVKCFIDYLDYEYKIKLLHVMLPKTRAYVKSCDVSQTKWTYFLIENDDLLQK